MTIYHMKRWLGRGAVAIALLLPISGCSNILEIDDPDIIEPEALNSALGAEALYAGAVGDFALAKDGGNAIGIAQWGGWFTDEFRFGGTPPATRDFDRRDIPRNNANLPGLFRNLHRSRTAAEKAARIMAEVLPGDSRIGELYAVSSYVYILVGEHFCSGTPFGEIDPELVQGTPLSTTEIFNQALSRLDQADQGAGGDPNIVNLTAILRGRALVNLGQYAAGATAVAGVPTAYQYFTYHSTSTPRQEMFMYPENYEVDRLSIAFDEGINGLDFATAGDPRLPTRDDGISRFDQNTPMFRNLLWEVTQRSSPILSASGVEARLIQAEAALDAGDINGWAGFLDQARSFYGMGGITDPGTAAGRVDLTFRERAFTMFATGHRLGDMRRLVRQYGRAATTIYPIGAYHKDNLDFGNLLTIPVPQSEENNPNYSPGDCTDTEA